MNRYFIRCLAGGDVIGSMDVDWRGNPLTKSEAERLCQAENERAERIRLAERRKNRFEFIVWEAVP